MFKHSRRVVTLAATAMSFVLFSDANAGTELDYNSTYDELQGYSTTFIYTDKDWECTRWEDIWYSGWGWLPTCFEVAYWHTGAGVRGWITNPSNYRYFWDEEFVSDDTATIHYVIGEPGAGNWFADAEHWIGYYYYTCPPQQYSVYYPLEPDVPYCELDWEDPAVFQLSTSWDGVAVP